ncbi:MAG: hypothetical protein EAZ65_03200 [Verrucomicrobia bacterium]|nr:MAG: hypothetical protein EAZ84_09970 [Verrucomicrobiota bacterium]TAE88386.1 MAG: hypothetical protein EAZ82_03885 [Verrucomicrobiota bacterium]TAF26840.1 MAG: hypothetical protein EAZ71_03195 [Verrucomicrobiota bacterium]TAF42098.1 MAG: hypothetical protein EAZ65_03200 [Verrucomicrobiota bacterium]
MRPIVVLLAGLSIHGASAAPRLQLSTEALAPESRIELVLDHAAAGEDRIGKEARSAWLDIQPAWPGSLFWKEANVLEFRPAQAPALGTTYRFQLIGQHAHLDGSTIPNGELARIKSEPFQIDYATLLDRYEDDWSPRSAAYFLRFNGDVLPEKAAPFLFFEADGGKRVAARTERASFARLKQPGYLGASWSERFAHRGQAPATPELTPELELPNGLIVTPLQPLPIGQNWRLSVLTGLPDASGKAKFPQDSTRYLGEIDPLRVERLVARVTADAPRRIVADFNVRLPADLPTSMVRIEPTPKDLRIEVRGDELHILGDFAGEANWHVTLDAALGSFDGRALGQPFAKSIEFRPLKPELAIASQDESQLASGTRKYRVQTVNLDLVKVRVKRLDATQLIRAQQGYRHYTGNGHDGKTLKPTHLIPYEMLAGETIVEFDVPLANALDTTQALVLDWDQVLADDAKPFTLGFPKNAIAPPLVAKPAAAFFLEIAGTPKVGTKAEKNDNPNDGENDGPPKSPVVQALVQLTDIGLAWKIIDGEARVFAFSCLSGKPLADVSLATFGEDAKPLQQTKTGPDGMALLPRDASARHLQASLGDDRYSVAYDTTLPTVGLWRFPVRYSWEPTALEKRRVFLFTDRSLYRPGEKVHLKGIVRRQSGNEIGAQPAAKSRIVVTDPTSREILSKEVNLSPKGGFDLSFDLPAETTGYHRITFEYPDELATLDGLEDWSERALIESNSRFQIGLRVEEFRRNAFEIKHQLATPQPGAKEVSLDLQARYYQGQPVAKGEVETFTHITETNFYPEKFRDHLFGDHRFQDFGYWYHYFGYRWDDAQNTRQNQSESTKTTLADDGSAHVVAKLPDTEFPMARTVSISTEVTDANRQTLGKSTEAIVHPSSVYVGISRLDRLVRVGDRIPLEIVALGIDGEAIQSELKIDAKLSREVNDQVRIDTGKGRSALRNETRREELSTTPLTLADGSRTEFLFAPQSAGLHQIELRGRDPEGRPFATAMSIHVYGGDEYPWAYEDGMRIKLVPEKKLYQPGETARVLVLSPIEGTALVTVEREKVLRSFMIELKADKPVIEIPFSDTDAPNAFVSVLVVKGAQDSAQRFKEPQLRLGYCELMVENIRDKLAVKLDLPTESVRPGTELEIAGSIVLADGQPAANAEVTLYAEDEGTLAVMGYETPNPMAHFYEPRELRVNCGTTLDKFIPESPDEQTLYNKGFFIGGGDDELGGMSPAMRSDFNPCAGWRPAITTDAAGRFAATFKMPDTLTRYRVIAIAHHGETRFGHTDSELVVSKELMIEPQAPRFANEGDTLTLRALVQNASDHSGTWNVSFTANPPGSDPIATLVGTERQKTIALPAGGSATVLFPITLQNTGEAVVSWKAEPLSLDTTELTPALATKLQDQVESRFQVQYPVPLLRQTRLVNLGGRQIDLLKELDPSLLKGRGHIELEFSRSLLAEAAGSVDYLLSYPYGCVEQTTSSMMPWLAVDQLRDVVPSFEKYPEAKVKAALQKGVDRLLSMQQPDGGFSYWPGNHEIVPWASAYAGLGLVLAEQKGAVVPHASLAALATHLETSLRGLGSTTSSYELENVCRAVWILAILDRQPAAAINALKDRIADLNPRARCLLALAAHTAKIGNSADILRNKTKCRLKDDAWMPWQNDHAMSLFAWSVIDPESPETTAALHKLISDRNPYGHWRTTWVNAWALLALGTYAEHQEEAKPATITLTSNEGPRTLTLEAGKPAPALDFPLGSSLTLKANSDESAYVRVKLSSKPDLTPQKPVAKNGMQITRFYERVKSDGSTEPLAKPKLGDLVRITLRVELPDDDSRYLIVEDRLPAIFEAVNNDFASQSAHSKTGTTSEQDWSVSHSELRSDRALFFFDRVWSKGRQEIHYLARCTMEGKAVAPPAKVESMYDPDQTALSASREF